MTTATGGTASASPSTAPEGTEITLTATPEEGWYLKDWTCDPADVEISVDADDPNKAAFTMPAHDVTVTPVFAEKTYGLTTDPGALDFGQTWAGDPTPAGQTVTLTNTGDQPLTVTLPTAAGYTVTAGDGGWNEGTVTIQPGDTATFTVQPSGGLAPGRHDGTLTVTGTDGEESVTAQVDLRFGVDAYIPPVTDPDPDPEPTPAPGEDDDGPDGLNTEDHYAYLIGFTDGTIRPEESITRAEVATIFFRLLTDEARETYWSQVNSYTDVDASDWFNNAVSTLTNMGILEGDGEAFHPQDPITKAEFATIAVRFFDDTAVYQPGTFTDVDADAWYADYVQAAADMGLVEGDGTGRFEPMRDITRAEAVTIVNRTLGRAPHEDHLLPWAEMNVWPDNGNAQAWYYADIQEATNSHDYTWTAEAGESVEQWTAKLPERDWAALERQWASA